MQYYFVCDYCNINTNCVVQDNNKNYCHMCIDPKNRRFRRRFQQCAKCKSKTNSFANYAGLVYCKGCK